MVNVNKNIMPGKPAKSSSKAEPQAPARRPRNQELNSSKKFPDSIKNRRKQKLNCSREQVIDQLVNEEQIYTQEEAEELVSSFEEQTGATVERLATVEEVEEQDGEFWATKDGRTTLWCRGNGMWYDSGISAEGDALDSSCGDKADVDSSKKLNCAGDKPGHMSNKPLTLDLLKEMCAVLSPEWGRQKSDAYVEECHESEKLDHPDYDENWLLHQHLWDYFGIHEEDLDKLPENFTRDDVINIMEDPDMFRDNNVDSSKKLNCSAEDTATITTESGNEVSISDIQIIQNPDTNELSLFIKEDEDEEIPEGFVVIATATQAALPAGDTCPNCGQDPCVCEGEGELDSSKKKN